ncbi:unnamed protein product [Clavelina lepadiformis]|uniref:Uncharacterized protein n=1 Tax=Clavelina lepadiformis TaxID=159417 RepID=A0ABP0FED7_CLALP
MAPIVFPTTSSPDTTQVLVPIWILIAVGAYIVLIILILSIRQCLVARGICADCNCFGKSDEEDSCFDCFLACAQFCNCDTPDLRSCCDSICGPRRRCDFGDCATCDCGDGSCELPCPEIACPDLSCPTCQCPEIHCEKPTCDEIICCCININLNC